MRQVKIQSLRGFRGKAAAVLGRRAVGTTAAVAFVSSLLVVAAVRADGAKATNVSLDDGTVWVSNGLQHRVGRLNIRSNELDLAAQSSNAPDVLQEGRTVLYPSQNGGVVPRTRTR
jgi:large repetitive protein